MVRAAATGAFNYAGSDPRNKHWRIKHRLIISELESQEERQLLKDVHKHWLGYVAHGNLTQESFEDIKQRASKALQSLKTITYPWEQTTAKPEVKNDTIRPEDESLIERYKKMQAQQEG